MNSYKPIKEIYGRRVYIGNFEGEEFFLTPIKWDCDWYFGGFYLEGLRPTTEEKQKEYARDCELSEYYSVDNIPSQYLDEEAFKKEMVDSWEERAEIQTTQERNGEEIYLCFGTHTHADSVLLNKCKGNYKKALNKFDKLFLNKNQFNKLIDLLNRFYEYQEQARKKHQNKGSLKLYREYHKKTEEVLSEYENFIKDIPEFPTKEFWIDVD